MSFLSFLIDDHVKNLYTLFPGAKKYHPKHIDIALTTADLHRFTNEHNKRMLSCRTIPRHQWDIENWIALPSMNSFQQLHFNELVVVSCWKVKKSLDRERMMVVSVLRLVANSLGLLRRQTSSSHLAATTEQLGSRSSGLRTRFEGSCWNEPTVVIFVTLTSDSVFDRSIIDGAVRASGGSIGRMHRCFRYECYENVDFRR